MKVLPSRKQTTLGQMRFEPGYYYRFVRITRGFWIFKTTEIIMQKVKNHFVSEYITIYRED